MGCNAPITASTPKTKADKLASHRQSIQSLRFIGYLSLKTKGHRITPAALASMSAGLSRLPFHLSLLLQRWPESGIDPTAQ